MLEFDIKNASEEQLEEWFQATEVILKYMQGDRLDIHPDDIVDRKIPDDLREAYTTLNLGLSSNGFLFDNDSQGFLPRLMKDFFAQRKAMKKKSIQAKDAVEKITTELKARGVIV